MHRGVCGVALKQWYHGEKKEYEGLLSYLGRPLSPLLLSKKWVVKTINIIISRISSLMQSEVTPLQISVLKQCLIALLQL